jgi:hypothetical protein
MVKPGEKYKSFSGAIIEILEIKKTDYKIKIKDRIFVYTEKIIKRDMAFWEKLIN